MCSTRMARGGQHVSIMLGKTGKEYVADLQRMLLFKGPAVGKKESR